jgi:hypothetical protein
MPIREVVSQISPPIRILLIGAAVFLAAWFIVLRPKPAKVESATPAATPAGNVHTSATATTGLGKSVESAQGAVATSDATSAKIDGASGGQAAPTPAATATTPGSATTSKPDAKPATPAPVIPADALKGLPVSVSSALESRKVLVLGVLSTDHSNWRPLADDDRYVRNALRDVNTYKGDVVVKQVSLANLSTYGVLVNHLSVNQSPSIVVIDRDLKATVLTGYVDRISINQAIADARRASIVPPLTDPYLVQANQVCAQYEVRVTRWSLPTVRGKKAARASLLRLRAVVSDYTGAIRGLAPSARWSSLNRQWLSVMKMRGRTLGVIVKRNGSVASFQAALAAFDTAAVLKLDHRFDSAGLTACSIERRS